jgi:hypothetical protein
LATQILPVFPYTRFAFQHVANYDGTSNSICRRCHHVIATSHNEYSLEQSEHIHICRVPSPQQVGSRAILLLK